MGDIRIFFDEELRLNELSHYNVLMEEKEEIFCDLAKIAMLMTSTPLAGVSLVDKKNVWLKGRVGVDLACLEREGAFCSYAVESNQDIFAVSDAQLDPRFKKTPWLPRHLTSAFMRQQIWLGNAAIAWAPCG